MKKFLLALAAALALSVPAFATDNFAPLPVNIQSGSHQNINYTSTDDVYACVRGSQVLLWSLISNVSVSRFGVDAGGSNVSSTAYIRQSVGDYYVGAPGDSVNLSDFVSTPAIEPFPSGTTDVQVADALALYLASSGSTVASTFTVPCGNVLYFQVSAEQDVSLSAQMPQLSYLVQFGSNEYGPWGDTGIEFGPAASLPSSGTTFPILSMDSIQWGKGEPKNILGQSRVGVATKHCIVGQWYALFCPLTSPQVLDASTGDHAMGASVVVSGSFSQVKVYPLSETLDYDNPLGATYESGSNDGYDSYFDGSSDENGTVTWTNQDGQVQAPQSGGTNYVSPAANAESLLSQIRQLLANIVSELKSLFTFGYEAVQDLVRIMRDFVNVLGGLYTWLPAEVYSALMSAVVIAIVIGVFKVFL